MVKKIKYNAFKMWGSYVGAAIFGFIAFSFGSLCNIWGSCDYTRLPILWAIGLILGFLVGWGIHSLIRRIGKSLTSLLNL